LGGLIKYNRQRQNMNIYFDSKKLQTLAPRKRFLISLAMLILTLVAAGLLAGCQTQLVSTKDALNEQAAALNAMTNELMSLREGDVLKISFPGSPTLNTTQTVRRDGKITMQLIGEVDVVGKTPSALEQKLVDLYSNQISSKQVTVEVVSSSLTIYVTGMVLRPGKILSDHPISALEALMEAGGPDFTKANLKSVVVIRREGNVLKNHSLNVKDMIDGKKSELFYLKPGDIVYVPERFSVF
jgi:protein involved in polysaccharide export with SLBB domain